MQVVINGIADGAVIALIALGFQLVRVTCRFLPLGLGGSYLLAPFLTWSLLQLGTPTAVAWAGGALTAAGHAAASEAVVHWPLSRRSRSESAQLVAALAVLIVTVQAVTLAWSVEPRMLNAEMSTDHRLGGIQIAGAQLLAVALTLASLLATWGLLLGSKLGRELRALSDEPELLSVLGRNARLLRMATSGLAGALVGMAALLRAWDVGFDSSVAMDGLLLGLVASVIGGRTSLLGSVLGGGVLGLTRSVAGVAFGAQWQTAATFGLLAAVLALRPDGLIRLERRAEAEA